MTAHGRAAAPGGRGTLTPWWRATCAPTAGASSATTVAGALPRWSGLSTVVVARIRWQGLGSTVATGAQIWRGAQRCLDPMSSGDGASMGLASLVDGLGGLVDRLFLFFNLFQKRAFHCL